MKKFLLCSLLLLTSCNANTKQTKSKAEGEKNTSDISKKADSTSSKGVDNKQNDDLSNIKLPEGLKDKKLFALEKQIYPILEKRLRDKTALTKEDIQVYNKFDEYLKDNFPDNKTEYDIVRCFQDAHQEVGRITMDILDKAPQKLLDYESQQGLVYLEKIKTYFEA